MLPLSCEVVKTKTVFLAPDLQGVCHRFRTGIFKLHLLSSMWPVLGEFRSAISQGSGRKKKDEEDRIALKPKSADDHVGGLIMHINKQCRYKLGQPLVPLRQLTFVDNQSGRFCPTLAGLLSAGAFALGISMCTLYGMHRNQRLYL